MKPAVRLILCASLTALLPAVPARKERKFVVEGVGGPSWYTEYNVLTGLSVRSFGRIPPPMVGRCVARHPADGPLRRDVPSHRSPMVRAARGPALCAPPTSGLSGAGGGGGR